MPRQKNYSKTTPIEPDSIITRILNDVQKAIVNDDKDLLEDAITRSRHLGVHAQHLAGTILRVCKLARSER